MIRIADSVLLTYWPQVFGPDLDVLDVALLDLRHDVDLGERGLAAMLLIEG
jgi:hypothetical protein